MLSAHFDLDEFDQDGAIPPACIPVLTDLCEQVLEPVRAQFGPLKITSGYRPPEANAEAHGQPNSEHIFTVAWCAADFFSPTVPSQQIFDWMRNSSVLPYHQLILETGQNGSAVIHVSVNNRMPGARSVLIGATHNAEPYTKVAHVDFESA
jgi:zinc D-Ala-D-Ala carboxypeptidase